MYVGSEAFQTANRLAIQKHRISGSVDSVPFTAAHILGGSLTVTRQSSDSTNSKIGGVFIGQLTCTFMRNLTITGRSWVGRKITLKFSLCVDEDADTWETFQLGEFIVAKAEIVPDGISVTAYDVMTNFDAALPAEYITSGTLYSILSEICTICGVTFGMNESDCEDLPNGDEILGLYQPNDCKTYRDVLYWLAVTVGGWAEIDWNGRLVLKTYDQETVLGYTIDDTERVNGASFSDFITDYGAATFENDDGTVETIGSIGVGVTYEVGFNPFEQYGLPSVRTRMRSATFGAIFSMRYMPFKIDLLSSPIFELGDVVYLAGGIIDDLAYHGIVQKVTYTAGKGVTLEGFGANPKLQSGSTKDQASRAVQQATQISEIVYKKYENPNTINIGDQEQATVVNIDFTTTKETEVEIWHEVQLMSQKRDGTPEAIVQAVYYMDGIEQDRKPVEVYEHDGAHLLTLHYTMPIEEIGGHNWQVQLYNMDGELIVVPENGVLALLKGQGIAKGDAWTGVIILDDEVGAMDQDMDVLVITDAVDVALEDLETIEVTETVSAYHQDMTVVSLADSVEFKFYQPSFYLVDESKEYNITDESGDYQIITE